MALERKYVPILKWKKGEKVALENLTDNQRATITPLLEIIDDEDPSIIIRDVSNYNFGNAAYIDTRYVDDEDGQLLLGIINDSENLYPVVYYEDLPHIADKLYPSTDRFLIRLSIPEDIDGDSYEIMFNKITEWSTHKKISIDVMLDLNYLENKNKANTIFLELKNVLSNHILNNDSIKNVIIASTTFPESLSSLNSGDDLFIERYEMRMFKKILQNPDYNTLIDRLIFSDYGVTRFTDTEIDFSKLKNGILPKARYTTTEQYWILKGKKDSRTKELIRSHKTIASEIMGSKYYYGENFSFGDLEIKERALGLNKKGPGNNVNWVAIAANHHIAVVAEELSNLYDF
ncbi:hypothetical protein J31TS6_40610 [Brevibacillus reuszeri]|uniref:beta family protein n=1 Tax=Brevibacillus reuszeri TaxID=54915 RepID=UPI001B2A7B5E|nr:hypothetical protein [Brevibacillus reuszeri]GIO08033.1 hypothetical protein J31TS6_40610 [Brevibacillus reuszeri]